MESYGHLLVLLLLVAKNACCIMNPGDRRPPYYPATAFGSTGEAGSQNLLPQHHQGSLGPSGHPPTHFNSIQDKINYYNQQESSQGVRDTHSSNTRPDSIKIQMSSTSNLTGSRGNERLIYFIVRNDGVEDEVVHLTLENENGLDKEIIGPSEFHLTPGASREVPVKITYPTRGNEYDLTSKGRLDTKGEQSITISARGKRTIAQQRTFFIPDFESGYGGLGGGVGGAGFGPFCYDRYVTGTCRYRQDPVDCLNYEWTAYATIQNPGGLYSIRSIPEGLYVPDFVPGTRDRVRVFLRVSCCTPYVQFISSDHFFKSGSGCIVDVRELQSLHPAEIAGIVIGAILLLIVIAVLIGIMMRRQRHRTILVGHTVRATRGERSRSLEREVVTRE